MYLLFHEWLNFIPLRKADDITKVKAAPFIGTAFTFKISNKIETRTIRLDKMCY